MRVVFCSNYLNHHQIPFCKKMYELCEGQFYFVAMEPMEEERLNMGWRANKIAPFEIRAWTNDSAMDKTRELIETSDVVIYGGGLYAPLMVDRIQQNKLTFCYSERLYRNGILKFISPRGQYYKRKYNTKYKNNQLFLLSSGAYTPFDFSLVGAYRDKAFKWGYFPATKHYDLSNLMPAKIPHSILWVSRFIDLKHPEKVIKIAKNMKIHGYKFHVDMIGVGTLAERIKNEISVEELENEITIHGSMPPEQVRTYMEKSEIFLMTSDYQEGWGAVINEAMNSGCAVVASHAIGAVPYLIQHNKNGLIYHNSDINDLYTKVCFLLDHPDQAEQMGEKAYQTITELWNAEVAAKRLFQLIKKLQSGEDNFVEEGPCSKAKIIRQSKMYYTALRGEV